MGLDGLPVNLGECRLHCVHVKFAWGEQECVVTQLLETERAKSQVPSEEECCWMYLGLGEGRYACSSSLFIEIEERVNSMKYNKCKSNNLIWLFDLIASNISLCGGMIWNRSCGNLQHK